MKNIIKIILISALVMATLTGCNMTIVDTTYTYNYAVIQLPNGDVVEGEVESWHDYEGEQLQVTIGGVTYLCSSFNCVLESRPVTTD